MPQQQVQQGELARRLQEIRQQNPVSVSTGSDIYPLKPLKGETVFDVVEDNGSKTRYSLYQAQPGGQLVLVKPEDANTLAQNRERQRIPVPQSAIDLNNRGRVDAAGTVELQDLGPHGFARRPSENKMWFNEQSGEPLDMSKYESVSVDFQGRDAARKPIFKVINTPANESDSEKWLVEKGKFKIGDTLHREDNKAISIDSNGRATKIYTYDHHWDIRDPRLNAIVQERSAFLEKLQTAPDENKIPLVRAADFRSAGIPVYQLPERERPAVAQTTPIPTPEVTPPAQTAGTPPLTLADYLKGVQHVRPSGAAAAPAQLMKDGMAAQNEIAKISQIFTNHMKDSPGTPLSETEQKSVIAELDKIPAHFRKPVADYVRDTLLNHNIPVNPSSCISQIGDVQAGRDPGVAAPPERQQFTPPRTTTQPQVRTTPTPTPEQVAAAGPMTRDQYIDRVGLAAVMPPVTVRLKDGSMAVLCEEKAGNGREIVLRTQEQLQNHFNSPETISRTGNDRAEAVRIYSDTMIAVGRAMYENPTYDLKNPNTNVPPEVRGAAEKLDNNKPAPPPKPQAQNDFASYRVETGHDLPDQFAMAHNGEVIPKELRPDTLNIDIPDPAPKTELTAAKMG